MTGCSVCSCVIPDHRQRSRLKTCSAKCQRLQKWTFTCAVCDTVVVIKNKGRGRIPKVCSETCRSIYKKQYHKEYDARKDQKSRRRNYMKTRVVARKDKALEDIGQDAIDRDKVREHVDTDRQRNNS